MRNRFVSRMLAVLGFLAAAGAADAQSAGIIAGKVTETGGGPVAAATVLVQTGAVVVGTGTTGDDGAYRIGNVAAGTYSVIVRRIGFSQSRTENVRIAAGGTTTLDITLNPSAAILNPTTVTGVRGVGGEKMLESPNSISMISSERIAERPAATVTDHLKGQPGLSISSGGIVQANIVSRGFNNAFSTSMLMLQDFRFAGVPSLRVNVPFLFTGVGEDIERIEILQGPASALYGPNSGAGVLHVITKSPFASQGTTLTLDGGERSMFRLGGRHSGQINDQFAYKVSGEYFRASDFEYDDPNEPATWSAVDTRVPTARRGQAAERDFNLERYSGEARLDWRPSEDTEAITTLGYTMAASALEITTVFGAAQVKNWSYSSFQQRFRHKDFFAQVFYNASSSGNENRDDPNGTYYLRSGIPVVDNSSVLVAQAQQGLQLNRTKLTFGLDFIATDPQSEGTIFGRNDADNNITETGAYAQFTHPLSDKLDFMGAVRGDMNNRLDGTQFSPRAAFLYKAAPNHNFRFTFNRAFNSPASFEFYLDQWSGQPNVNLGPGISPPLGTEIRAIGNRPASGTQPGTRGGWEYDRSCAGAQPSANGLCLRTNFSGGVPVAMGGATLWPLVANALANNLAAGVPVSAASRTIIANALRGLTPTNASFGMILRNPSTAAITPFSNVRDIQPLQANFSNTFELGYKGILGDRLRLAVDYWYQIRPAAPTQQVVNLDKTVFFNPTELGAYLGAQMVPVLMGQGLTLAQAGGVVNAWVATPGVGLASLPVGVLNFDNPLYDQTYLVVTYQNGNGQVDVRGMDFAVDLLVNDMWTVEATFSNLSRNVFADAPGATANIPLAANAPKNRGTLTFRRVDETKGLSLEFRGRYMDAFPVASGVYNSFSVVTGNAVRYDRVPVNVFLDAGFSWRLPVAQNIRWSFNVANMLNNEVPTFAGVPAVGRFATTRIAYSF